MYPATKLDLPQRIGSLTHKIILESVDLLLRSDEAPCLAWCFSSLSLVLRVMVSGGSDVVRRRACLTLPSGSTHGKYGVQIIV